MAKVRRLVEGLRKRDRPVQGNTNAERAATPLNMKSRINLV